jgi:hypothetical protein
MKVEVSWPTDPAKYDKAEEEIRRLKERTGVNNRSDFKRTINSISQPISALGIVTGVGYNIIELIGWGDIDNYYQFGPLSIGLAAYAANRWARKQTGEDSNVGYLEERDKILRKYGGQTTIEGVEYVIIK